MVDDWKRALDNKENIAAIFIDLSKAFDTIPHSLLVKKLENYGLSNSAVMLIKSYLTSRYQRVKIGLKPMHSL